MCMYMKQIFFQLFCLKSLILPILILHVNFFFIFSMFIYFFERERDREKQSMSGEGAGREGDTESEAGSRLLAVRAEPDAGLELTNHLSPSRWLSRLRHPGAPLPFFSNNRL